MLVSRNLAVILLAIGACPFAYAFEDTKVLPAGVRNIDVRSVNTDFDTSADNSGHVVPLAEPLDKALTFKQVAQDETPLKANQLRAFLKSNNIDENESVGNFNADLKGHLSVFAPIMAYGFTDKLTCALGVPVYDATMSDSVGFQPNQNAQRFLGLLADPKNNQTASARDAASQFNGAVAKLNQKLANDHYMTLQDWHEQALGDSTLAAKYRAFDHEHLAFAATTGVVMPTGRTASPDNLTDIPFGYGVWAPYEEFALDEKIHHMRINEWAKYTNQLPNHKDVREVTDDEPIVDSYTATQFKLGDIVEGGASLLWEPNFGLMAGAGYNYHHKFGDVYRGGIDPATKAVLQRNSEWKWNDAEFQLGYSTVPLYMANKVTIPFDVRLTYEKQLASQNVPITDLAQFDLNLYF